MDYYSISFALLVVDDDVPTGEELFLLYFFAGVCMTLRFQRFSFRDTMMSDVSSSFGLLV